MHVGINTGLRGARGGVRQTGVSRYLTELVSGLHRTGGPEERLIELGRRTGPVRRRASARIAWEQTLLAADVARRRLDVFHGPVNTLPVAMRTRSVVTIHDLAFLRYPNVVPAARRAWLIAAVRHSARAATRIITVSRHTASDLVDWLRIDPDKIDVVPLAVSPGIRRLAGSELHDFRLKHDLERPHILAVGTLEPRKNLPMLIRAFAAVKEEIPHRLVLVGPQGWLSDELHETVLRLDLGDRLVLTGFVDDEALGGWYSSADLVACPSLYEGFGLPFLEAMSCGAPVLASGASALPEVGGDAAIYLDPSDEAAWSDAIRSLLGDPAARERMAEAGIERAAAYSWDETARRTWDAYREAAR